MIALPYLISSLVLLSTPSCQDSYIIQIPQNIDLINENSFDVSIVNNLNENQTLYVDFDDSFELVDKHGKSNIYGFTSNNKLVFECGDTNNKTIYYDIDNIPVGEWIGSLNMTISMQESLPTNTLMSGKDINNIFKDVLPNNITFSHEKIDGEYLYDLSLAQDESILLYALDEFNTDVVITNGTNEKMNASSDMSYMFSGCKSILKVENLNYVDFSKTQDLSYFFQGDSKLATLQDVGTMDVSSCKTLAHFFDGCSALKSVDLSSWNTSNCEDLSYMFKSSGFTSITGLNNFDTSKVKDLSYTFNALSKMTSLNVDNWDVENVETMTYTFGSTIKLTSLNLSGWNPKSCKNFASMFQQASVLTTIGDISSWNTSNVESMNSMFMNCKKLQSLNLSNFDTHLVTDMANMFYYCNNLTTIGDVSNWDVSNVATFNKMFYISSKLNGLSAIENWDVSYNCVDTSYMFYNNPDYFPTTLNLNNWHVDNVKDMSFMFYNCFPLATLYIDEWNTINLENTASMFEAANPAYSPKLVQIVGIEDLNTSKVTDMSKMFYMNKDFNGNLGSWDTNNVTNLNNTFYSCWHLDLIPLENWNVSNVTDKTDCVGNGAGIYSTKHDLSWK